MRRHTDESLLPLHFCGRFGDAVGAELCVGDARCSNRVFLTNDNIPHEVSECVAGTRLVMFPISALSQWTHRAPALNRAWHYQIYVFLFVLACGLKYVSC